MNKQSIYDALKRNIINKEQYNGLYRNRINKAQYDALNRKKKGQEVNELLVKVKYETIFKVYKT